MTTEGLFPLSLQLLPRLSPPLTRSVMDFYLPTTLPVGGIPWEKVIPPLIPRLNGTCGLYNWTPNLLIPEADNTSSTEVTRFSFTLISLVLLLLSFLRFESFVNSATGKYICKCK